MAPVPETVHVVPAVVQAGVHTRVPAGIPLAPDDVAVIEPSAPTTPLAIYLDVGRTMVPLPEVVDPDMVLRLSPAKVPIVPLFSLQYTPTPNRAWLVKLVISVILDLTV